MHQPTTGHRVTGPARFPVLPATALAVAMCLAAVAARAEPRPKFQMTAVTDVLGGSHIMRGQYAAAASELEQARGGNDPVQGVWYATNLCVAEAKTGRLDAALAACDEAVAFAREPAGSYEPLPERARKLAVVHANRAIVHSMAGDYPSAERDLAVAREYAPRYSLVRTNAAAFDARRPQVAAD